MKKKIQTIIIIIIIIIFYTCMKLDEQTYLVQQPEGLETISHNDLLQGHNQIIRLKEDFHQTLTHILNDNLSVSLYNHYNPINTDLIRQYRSTPDSCNTAMTCKIVGHTNNEPILDGTSLQVVQILEMNNIWFEDILDKDLQTSLPFYWKQLNWEMNVANLHKWMSEQFYGWKTSIDDIQKLQKLFYRKIKLPNNN